jgi:2-keto-4-pentenoate hydratase/2-oxohepta-3-ene-1,7-dioic acid hydratase in catechol pathway
MKLPLPDVPSIFFKSRMAITGPGTAIKVPKIAQNEEMDYEVELAIIIGKDCLNVQEADALDHVLGYTCANDLTARKVQDTSSQWTFAKSQSSLTQLRPLSTASDSPRFRYFLPSWTGTGLASSSSRSLRCQAPDSLERRNHARRIRKFHDLLRTEVGSPSSHTIFTTSRQRD